MWTTLQTWATEVVPEARATVISLFAAALFAGSAVATMAGAPATVLTLAAALGARVPDAASPQEQSAA